MGMTGKDTAAPVITATAWIARDTTRQGTTVRVSIVSVLTLTAMTGRASMPTAMTAPVETNGLDRNGFDVDGFDRFGRDAEGYRRNGIELDGYNREGYDWQGYGRDRYNASGLGRAGHCRQYYSDHIKQLRDRLDEAYQQLQR